MQPSTLYANRGLTPDAVQTELLPTLDAFCKACNQQSLSWVEDKGIGVWRTTNGDKPAHQGLYLYGSVGRGKSMLMQDVFDSLTTAHKRRVHFHSFMEELHTLMHEATPPKEVDRTTYIASEIAKELQVLCFDEFFITNIADGMMLGRLIEALFFCGVTLCATSNWQISDLFQDGYNRSHIMPFMKLLNAHMDALNLGAGTDFRKQEEVPLSHSNMAATFKAITGTKAATTPFDLGYFTLEAKGLAKEAIWTSFHTLCTHALGRAEYLSLVSKHHHILIDDIPLLDTSKTEAIMRFIVLVDIAYEAGVPVLLSSEHNIETLCTAPDARFAFERTLSRIHELAQRYQQKHKIA